MRSEATVEANGLGAATERPDPIADDRDEVDLWRYAGSLADGDDGLLALLASCEQTQTPVRDIERSVAAPASAGFAPGRRHGAVDVWLPQATTVLAAAMLGGLGFRALDRLARRTPACRVH